jgi:NAD(P)-dependent dehydrogenase (short-subunit alcohol dehydrogenase family)
MFNGKTAVVTGAGSGIGRAIAEALLNEKCKVIFSDVSHERLEKVLEELGNLELAHSIVCDVSQKEQVDKLITESHHLLGKIDILVNCAGIYDGYAGIEETSEDLWKKIIDVNLTGCFYACKSVSNLLIQQKFGRIINIASVGGLRGSADGLAYTTSKFGMIGLTKRLSVDLGKHNVTVNAVCPGVIQTAIRNNSAEILGGLGPDMNTGVGVSKEFLNANVPLLRKGTPEEVAEAVLFLASEKASYMTGLAIAVDGGWTAT